MRIDRINSIYEANKIKLTATVQNVNQVSSRDQVALSETAKDFSSIYRKLSSVPEIREEKVNEIKSQMENGTYNVKSSQVAEKILSQYNIQG